MPVLLKFDSNYADEFDVSGFVVLSSQEWEEYKIKFREIVGDNSFEYGFGTNESLTFNNADDYLESFSVTEISDTEHEFLLKNFGRLKLDEFDRNNKNFAIQKQMVDYGHIPYYSNDDLKHLKEGIEEGIQSKIEFDRGEKDAMTGLPAASNSWDYIEGFENGTRRKKYNF